MKIGTATKLPFKTKINFLFLSKNSQNFKERRTSIVMCPGRTKYFATSLIYHILIIDFK